MRTRIVSSETTHLGGRFLAAGFFCSWLLAIAGCGPTVQYKVGDQVFSSREEAMQRIDQVNNDVLASIPPTERPVHGTVTVAVPTLEQIKDKGVKWTGSTAQINQATMAEMVDYTGVTILKALQFMGSAIERRGIFDRVSRTEDPMPENLQADTCDFLIYYYLVNPEVQGWYVKGKGLSEPKPLILETGKALGVPRTVAWLDNLESVVLAAKTK